MTKSVGDIPSYCNHESTVPEPIDRAAAVCPATQRPKDRRTTFAPGSET